MMNFIGETQVSSLTPISFFGRRRIRCTLLGNYLVSDGGDTSTKRYCQLLKSKALTEYILNFFAYSYFGFKFWEK
jgi:hypothetical protein